jgi:hypothetical protein
VDFGKITVSDLRALIDCLPLLEEEHRGAIELAREKPHLFESKLSGKIAWCHFYELPFQIHIAHMMVGFDLVDPIKEAASADRAIPSLIRFATEYEPEIADDELEELDEEQLKNFVHASYALATSIIKSLQCLLTFGCYINDFIAEVRMNGPGSDPALFNAIKIDPSVLGCPSVAARVSKAIMLNEDSFLSDLSKSINAPLKKREQANFQKMRLVLKVLAESNAQRLSDDELYKLFVTELRLYSGDSEKGDAKKSLSKFARTYRSKSTTEK